MSIPEKILQAGCDAYAATFLNGNGSLGDGIEAAYFAIHGHDDWVRAGPPAWNGEGLPPVGTVCEYTSNGGLNWRETSVLFIDEQVVLLSGYTLYKLVDPDIAFRPIRTPEQIAADERSKAIEQMVYGAVGCERDGQNTKAFLICGFLYDAGYRKQVES